MQVRKTERQRERERDVYLYIYIHRITQIEVDKIKKIRTDKTR